MSPLRQFVFLAAGASLLVGGCASGGREAPALKPEQATSALSLEERGANQYWAGNPLGAMQLYQEALTLWHSLDDVHGIIRCRTAILGLLRETADAANRGEWLRQTQEIWRAYEGTARSAHEKSSVDYWRSLTLLHHSLLLWALDAQPPDVAGAESALRAARTGAAHLTSAEQRRWQLALRNLEAQLRLVQGNRAAAARLLDVHFTSYEALGNDRESIRETAQGCFLAGQLQEEQHRWPDAATRYQEALTGFRLLGQVPWMQNCLEHLVEVCRREGRLDLAQQYQLRLEAQRRSVMPEEPAKR